MAANRHDLSVIEVYDPRERNLPDVGLVHIKDSETGESAWVNTSGKKTRKMYTEWFDAVSQSATRLFNKYSIDNVSISTDEDYVKGLMAFFKKR